jgi:hypothetical protein
MERTTSRSQRATTLRMTRIFPMVIDKTPITNANVMTIWQLCYVYEWEGGNVITNEFDAQGWYKRSQ